MERANVNRWSNFEEDQELSIGLEFGRLRQASEGLLIAPQIGLPALLTTHTRDLKNGRLRAALAIAEQTWPMGHAPQAFSLAFARAIDRNVILTADGPFALGAPLESVSKAALPSPGSAFARVEKSGGRDAKGGPWLCLIAIGHPPEGGPLQLLKAWAQPILSGHHFLPVANDGERTVLRALMSIGAGLKSHHVEVTVECCLFGSVDGRSDGLKLDATCHRTGEVGTIVLACGLPSDGHESCDDQGRICLHEDLTTPNRLRRRLWGIAMRAVGRIRQSTFSGASRHGSVKNLPEQPQP